MYIRQEKNKQRVKKKHSIVSKMMTQSVCDSKIEVEEEQKEKENEKKKKKKSLSILKTFLKLLILISRRRGW